MAADIRGGVFFGLEVVPLGVVHKAAHGLVEVSARLEVHVGGVAIVADAAPGVVQHAHKLVRPRDHRAGARIGLEPLALNRATQAELTT